MTQYEKRVGLMKKRLAAAGNVFDVEDKIRKMLRVLPNRVSTTRNLAQEFKQLHFEVLAMRVAKEAELNVVDKHTTEKLPNPIKSYTGQDVTLRSACYG